MAFGGDVGSANTPDSSLANFWSQMAAHCHNSTNVIFGLMNEPHDQSATRGRRSRRVPSTPSEQPGVTQEILASGSDLDTASSWVSSGNAAAVGRITDQDNNLVFEVHQYFNQGSTGTSTSVLSPTIGPDSLASITQWAAENSKRLFLGEFGAGSDSASLVALGNTLSYINGHSNVWQGGTYWAAGPWMGSYMFSADPQNGVEAPQTALLEDPSISLPSAPKLTQPAQDVLRPLRQSPQQQLGGVFSILPILGFALQRRPHRPGIEFQGISYVFDRCNLLSRDLAIRLGHQQAGIESAPYPTSPQSRRSNAGLAAVLPPDWRKAGGTASRIPSRSARVIAPRVPDCRISAE
jgi:hypothetical protein